MGRSGRPGSAAVGGRDIRVHLGSLEPPLVVVSVGKKARMHARPDRAAVRREHPLPRRRSPPAATSRARPSPASAPAFGELAGVPVLAQAAVIIAARIKHRYRCGDHPLYVGEVQRLAVNDPAASPLLVYVGRYGSLASRIATRPAASPSRSRRSSSRFDRSWS